LLFVCVNIFLHTVQINTGILNLMSGGYDTSIQAKAPILPDSFYVYIHVLCTPATWLATLLALVAALLPDVVIRVLRKHWLVLQGEAKLAK